MATDVAPQVDLAAAPTIFQAVHRAIANRFVRSCHDLSEGGLAVAAAEMAFAGDRGFLVPELTQSATKREAAQVKASHSDECYSSSRTCEIGMTRATGQIYRSYMYLLEKATR